MGGATRDEARPEPAGGRRPSLWRRPDFVKFWLGMNVSFLGTQLSSLALPLMAVLLLQASPAQMGLLRATSSAASVVVGPLAGVLADRVRRRPLLVASDLGLALVALSIPAAYAAGRLRIELLYAAQFAAGGLAILSEVGMMAYLPSLVPRARLVEANSKVQASSAAVSVVGPGLAGLLVQALTAPVVILFDAASYLLSALTTLLIRAPEPPPRPASERRGVRAEIAEGLRFVYGHRLLRPMAEAIALHFLFVGMVYSVFVLYAVRELGLGPAALGVVFAGLGPGFMLGALLAPRAGARFGRGRVMAWAPLVTAAGTGLVPLAGGGATAAVATLVAAHVVSACGIQLNGIHLVSLRQAVTPHRLQGRMTASFRFVNLLASGVGALAAGWLAERTTLRTAVAVGACGLLLPFLRQFFSPVRALENEAAAGDAEAPVTRHRAAGSEQGRSDGGGRPGGRDDDDGGRRD